MALSSRFSLRAYSKASLGISPADTTTFISIATLLIAVAVFASLLPALQLVKLDPAQTLRDEWAHKEIDSAQAAGRQQGLTGQPPRISRSQKNGDGRDVLRLADSTERCLRFKLNLEVAPDNSHRTDTLGFHHAWIDRIHADFFRAKFF